MCLINYKQKAIAGTQHHQTLKVRAATAAAVGSKGGSFQE
jgi:hypothetical protein